MRLLLLLAAAAFGGMPLIFVFPTHEAVLRAAFVAISGAGFLSAALVARRGRREAALLIAATTLLSGSIVNAIVAPGYDAEALGVTVIAAVVVLPALSRRWVLPTFLVIGLAGDLAIAIARFAPPASAAAASPLGSVVAATIVLALTLAMVAWIHGRYVDALGAAAAARQELDASEARFRSLVEAAPDGILVIDPVTFRPVAANSRAAEMLGYATPEALVASTADAAADARPSDGPSTFSLAPDTVASTLAGRTVVQQLEYRRADGSVFPAEIRTSLVELGGQSEIRVSFLDITDRLAARRERFRGVARFRSYFETSPNAVVLADPRGRIVDASNQAALVFGYSVDQLRTMVIEDLVPDDARGRHVAERRAFDAHPEARAMGRGRLVQGLRADGTLFPAEIGLSWFETDEGRFATAIIVDVSERQAAERAVQQANETVRAIFDASPAGIAVLALDGSVRLWNRAMERLTGWAADQAAGRPDPSVREDAQADRDVVLQQVADNQTVVGADLLLARQDDTTFPAIGSFGPLHDSTGRVTGVVAVVEDVTNMRSLEAQVNRKARLEAIGQLAGGIAHDINNVLTAIGGFATLTLEDLDAGRPADRESIETIAEGAARTGALTRQLLAFARRDVRPAETLDLGAVVRSVEPMLRGLIGEHIALETHALGDGHVRVAASQIEQIVVNLVVNARDAMPNGGQIRIDVARVRMSEAEIIGRHIDVAQGPYVALSVTDDGTGMAPEVAERVFDPFFTTKGPDEGTGLGLATVHGIVTGVGGHVWVYSEEGVGTTFRILLPEVDAAPAAAASPDAPRRGEETVLLVEDEDVVRTLASRVLERAGYVVLAAGDPEEALEIAASHPGRIDLLLSDVIMPKLQGPELAQRIGVIRPGLRVLFTSGYTAGGAGVTASIPEDARFLDKPFTPSGLIAAIRAALDASPNAPA
ncbi:MAG TPA: PAS domain S-box protein [Candidatus Limnocylindrales bacterium]|nr:PAS domain S-box protein [Candidatus Limnocylindrales bacterium]